MHVPPHSKLPLSYTKLRIIVLIHDSIPLPRTIDFQEHHANLAVLDFANVVIRRWDNHSLRTKWIVASLFHSSSVIKYLILCRGGADHWLVCSVHRNPLTSKASHNNDRDTYITVPRVSFVAELTMGPDPKITSEATGSTRGSSPKGRMTFQKMLRYHARFCLVVPKRRKKATAKIGLTHWSNLKVNTVQNPADFHSSDVAVGIVEKDACTAFHPGQNPMMPSCKVSTTSWRIVMGNVRRISNKPRARSLRKPLLFMVVLLARVASRSRLRLKYVMIRLAVKDKYQEYKHFD